MRDFYTAVITEKPEDIYQFAREHFSAFQEWKKKLFLFFYKQKIYIFIKKRFKKIVNWFLKYA